MTHDTAEIKMWRGLAFYAGLFSVWGIPFMLEAKEKVDKTSWWLFLLPTILMVLLVGSCAVLGVAALGAVFGG